MINSGSICAREFPMKRFFIPPSEITRAAPVIDGPEAHHILKVFRLRPGDTVFLIDGSGMEYEAVITDTAKNRVAVSIEKEYQPATESELKITVGQGYLKDKKMDVLVRHLTELGIARWMPLLSEYSVAQPDMKKIDSRIQRWEQIAKEAVKQCRRTRVPEIMTPAALEEALTRRKNDDLKIMFYENETVPLTKLKHLAAPGPLKIFVLLGPEGGFSGDEIDMARSSGFITASLGPRILRAETASMAACALIQHLFGDMC